MSGLKRKTVKAQEFAKQVVGDGTPLKPAEVRDKFEAWLKAQIGTDDQTPYGWCWKSSHHEGCRE